MREYAIGLLKEETERDDAAPTTSAETHASKNNFSPLAFAILIGLVSLPLLLLFAPRDRALRGRGRDGDMGTDRHLRRPPLTDLHPTEFLMHQVNRFHLARRVRSVRVPAGRTVNG